MQRVKVGMTGLAFVMLLIGLAGVVFSTASREAPIAAAGAAKPEVVANITDAPGAQMAPKEPLAELGVAPSASGNNAASAKR